MGSEVERRGRPKRAVRWAAGLVVLVVVAASAFWAGRVTTRPAEVAVQAPADEAVVEVVEQELGRVITLTTRVTRPSSPLALNAVAGTVTQVSESGELAAGDLLYTVGQTPVVLVQGEVPFWRDLTEGTVGADVAQVQRMLAAVGADVDTDGQWGSATTQAVRAWQGERGFPVTGSFELGSVVAAPRVPVSVSIDTEVAWPGAMLSGGEEVVSVPDGDPAFTMEVTQQQAEMLPSGTEVTVQGGGSGWDGVITDSQVSEDGLILLSVTATDGGLVCGDECEELPAAGSTTFLTQVEIVPPVTGPVVPVAALTIEAEGSATVDVVTDGAAQVREVEVLTVADGLAVVDGVQAGEQVRVFGDDTSAPADPGNGGGPDPGSTETEETDSPSPGEGGETPQPGGDVESSTTSP